MTAFKKNQTVTLIQDWDHKGTVSLVHAIVYSCGKKVMVLTNAATGEEIGRNFRPVQGEGWMGEFVVEGHVGEDVALEIASKILTRRQNEAAHRISCNADKPAYIASIQKELDELHEPRVVRR